MTDTIIIGGSAGAFDCILSILKGLDKAIDTPIVIVVHRLKNSESTFESILQSHTHYRVKEIENNDKLQSGFLYTAPADYHVLLESDLSLSLDLSEAVNYSRPSIDVIFESFSLVLKDRCLGILLSGSNEDGARGLKMIAENDGRTVIQDCSEAAYENMPSAAKKIYKYHLELNTTNIIKLLNNEYK